MHRWRALCRHEGWGNLLPQVKGSSVTRSARHKLSLMEITAVSVTVCGDAGATCSC